MKRFFVFTVLCLVAGKAVRAQKNEPATIFKADLDITFDSGSNINAIPLDDRRISDLSVLGMVWGYVDIGIISKCEAQGTSNNEAGTIKFFLVASCICFVILCMYQLYSCQQ